MAEAIPEPLRKYVDDDGPKELRLTAAKGLIPLGPKELTHLLYLLTNDKDEEVSGEAVKSLDEIPPQVLTSVLSDQGSPVAVLDYFGKHSDNESLLEKLIVNSSTPDATISHLALKTSSQKLLELISNNHQRILRSSAIVEALSKNPMLSQSTLDNVLDYLSHYLEGNSQIPLRTDDTSPDSDEELVESFLDDSDLIPELTEEQHQESQEQENQEQVDEEAEERLIENISITISNMTVGDRIKFAIKGNREARTALVRDSNRIVSRAVLKNPRLTDTEIVLISQSKIVNDDILREISDTRRWVKMYPVKLALVSNPKTPSHISLNLVKHLRDHDLRALMWSKNLPGVITNTARNVMRSRRDGK